MLFIFSQDERFLHLGVFLKLI